MPILDSHAPISMTQREVAVVVAKSIAASGLPVPGPKFRNDVDHIQIDPIVIERRVTQPMPGVRLQFEVKEGMGVTLNINLADFEASPKGYLTELYTHLRPMMRNCAKMRRNRKLVNDALYDVMTEAKADG